MDADESGARIDNSGGWRCAQQELQCVLAFLFGGVLRRMTMRTRKKAILSVLLALGVSDGIQPAVVTGPLVVVANADTPAIDADTLQKIYLGKVVEVGGRPVVPVNLAKGNSLRTAFMEQVLAQDDDRFIAYWTVRRYIGKGSPPREFATTQEQLEFLRKTPGAVGYLSDAAQVEQGLKTILKKP